MSRAGEGPAGITVTALLLAGGLSSRMGCEKATLVFEGAPLWARQLNLLRRVEPRTLWISSRERPSWGPPTATFILDRPPSCGPLSGIALSLERMETTHLLVLAIDLPKMTAAHLAKLIRLSRPRCGVISANRECFEPLAAVYPKEAGPLAQHALDNGEPGMQALVKRLLREELLREYRLSPQETDLYLNLNSPADLPGQG